MNSGSKNCPQWLLPPLLQEWDSHQLTRARSEGNRAAPITSLQIFTKKDNYFWKGGGGWSISPAFLWKYSCAISRSREGLDFGKPVCQHWKGVKSHAFFGWLFTFLPLYWICDWKHVFMVATSGHQNISFPLTIGHSAASFCCSFWVLLGKEDQDLRAFLFLLLYCVHPYIFILLWRKKGDSCMYRESLYLMPLKRSCLNHGGWQMLSKARNNVGNDGKI